jgi:O-antigen/teichoic acid export membrane protein
VFNDLVTIVYSFSASLFFATMIGFVILYTKYLKPVSHTNVSFKKEIFKYNIPLFFTAIGIMFIGEIDTVMLGILSSDVQVGIYSASKQIISKLPHIALAISLGTMPIFAKLNSDNRKELNSLFIKLLKINSLIFGSIVVILLTTAWFFVPLLFGQEYIGAVLPLQILTVYLITFSFSVFLNAFLDYQGKAKKRAINISFSVVLNIILNYLLIPRYGATGAAIATTTSYLPYVVLNWFEVRKFLR